MINFNLYTKTYGNGVKEVYLPLFPVSYQSPSPPIQLHAFPVTAEQLQEAEDRRRDKNLRDTLNRARKMIYAVAVCNDWDYFVTFTLAKNRYDLEYAYSEVRYRLKYLKFLYPRFNYCIVAEKHKDGAYHFHGLISGLSEKELGPPVRTQQGIVYDLKRFRTLGYSQVKPIYDSKDKSRVGAYLTKYITKEIVQVANNKASYIVSRGLRRPERHRYQIRGDEVEHFRRLMYLHKAQVFETPFGTSFLFDDLDLSDKEMFDSMFVLCSFFDDDY